jgi:hypothetical protein
LESVVAGNVQNVASPSQEDGLVAEPRNLREPRVLL